jgi:hypothetical protein
VVVTPHPHPETVEALLDTTWRVAQAEAGRTDSLDRKASTVATFASLLATLTAAFGARLLEEVDQAWSAVLFSAGLLALVGSAGFAVAALLPKESTMLGMAYLQRFPTWSEILKPPEQVRGETMQGVLKAIATEREANERKARSVRRALVLLAAGLGVLAAEAGTLAWRGVLE